MNATLLFRLNRVLPYFLPALLIGGSLLGLGGCNSHPTRPPETAAPPNAGQLAQPATSRSKLPVAAIAPAPASTRPAASPDTTAAQVPAAPSAPPPIKLKVEPGKPPYRMLPGGTARYYRYVGRLGTQPVVLEVLADLNQYALHQPLSGGYYDARRGVVTELSATAFRPRRLLQFTAYPADDSVEHWRAQQPLGPWLTGTVTAGGKRPRRFVLREDYHDAVPLAIRTATMYGRPVVASFGDRGEPGQFTGNYCRQYVQVLGSAARRPELQRAFPSRPAQVRARLRQEFREGEADLANINEYLGLYLNDYGILCYSKYISDFSAGASHPQNIYQSFSYDLHTGRRITLASLLRPRRTGALRRLALSYMDSTYLAELKSNFDNSNAGAEYLAYVDLEEAFGLSPAGLMIEANIGSHAMGPTTITVPYAKLRPLLRPRTPLNRVLAAQGLQPVL